jgi:hypothetical protein
MSSRTAPLLALGLTVVAACGGEGATRWTVEQAESIAVVRGTPVNDQRCQGIGAEVNERFERFRCTAGARRPTESVDTVAVLYELVPEEDYNGPASRHRLEKVSFLGGPGIP